MRSRLFGYSLPLLTIAVVLSGCDESRVKIPPSGQDKAPVVTIRTMQSGGSSDFKIEKPEAVSPIQPGPMGFTRVIGKVTAGMKLVIFCEATNPVGGTKYLEISIVTAPELGSPKEIKVRRDGNVVDGKALETLRIYQKDGNPLIVDTTGLTSVIITAEAANYDQPENGTTKLEVLHYSVPGYK